jgi:eukaryotic-like serine/threonine-protein kinase
MPLAPGTRLGPYEVISAIGVGGMGEVYAARDPRLNRTVAIKILLDHISDNPEARARFEREAQLIAGLSHPHISTLHDIGRHEGTDYLVMELLEGETLAQRLERGPIPLDQALQHAIEIADALDQAHRHGVTHRDLKPGNVMLTRSGVKLLDFGLAKLRQSGRPSGLSNAATQPREDVTSEGTILGTLQYMAPEQLEGTDADARTDIFAFGSLLHEMVTGQRAFEGKSRMSLMGAILRDMPPPASTIQRVCPPALDRLIATCLAKEPDDRWQSARDVRRELKWIADSPPASSGAMRRDASARTTWFTARVSMRAAAALALVAAVLAGAAIWTIRPTVRAVPRAVARASVALPPGDQIGDATRVSVALSPDGALLAYIGRREGTTRLYIRAIDSLEARAVPGTENAAAPFFSPDGRWIGLFAQGKLKKVPASGGAVQILCDAVLAVGGTWSADDTIYFAPFNTSGIWRVSAGGGTPRPVTTLNRSAGEVSHRWPQVLPGGKALLFTAWTGPGFDERHLQLQMLDTGERRILVPGASGGRYVASGHLLYSRDDALMVVPFDLARLQVSGSAAPLPERALDDEGPHFSVSDSGILAYVPASARRFERRLVWVDAAGNVEPLPIPSRAYTDPTISPDGRSVAFTTLGAVETVGIYDFARHTLSALTATTAGSSQAPVWAPDGSRLADRGTRAGFRNLFWKAVDGSAEEVRLTTSEDLQTPTSWSNANQLAFTDVSVATGYDIWVLPMAGGQPQAVLKTTAIEANPTFSRDGRWLAYISTESGTSEVYVRPFPGPGRRLQVSTDGGFEPVWSRNGRELFYRRGDVMMASAITTDPALTAGLPRTLFKGLYMNTDTGGAGYDVAADGRFLMVQPVEAPQPATSISLVLNWFDELRRTAPPAVP